MPFVLTFVNLHPIYHIKTKNLLTVDHYINDVILYIFISAVLDNYLIYLYNHYLFIDVIIILHFLQLLPSVKGLCVFYCSGDSNSTFGCKWLEGSNYFHQCIATEYTSERIALYASTLILHKMGWLQNQVLFTIASSLS